MMENEHFENQKHEWDSALHVSGSEQPAVQVNPMALQRLKASRQTLLPVNTYIEGVLAGDITMLSKAITLIESSLPEHQRIAQEIIAGCIPHSGKALRLGITGVPGAGKSTFIEALGMELCSRGNKIAVLAIDPSSQRSRSSETHISDLRLRQVPSAAWHVRHEKPSSFARQPALTLS